MNTQTITPITILVVDDEATVRAGLRMRLELEPDFLIVGEASDGLEALELVPELQPSMIVMDIEMPHMDGITAAAKLQAMTAPIPVIISSIHDDAHTRARSQAAGAAAFIGKQEGVERLIKAIRCVAKK